MPKRNRGKTKTAKQVTRAASTRKWVSIARIRRPEIPMIKYFPTAGISASHREARKIRSYSRSGLGSLSALRPPYRLPRAMAIMMVPMMMVQTIWEEEK